MGTGDSRIPTERYGSALNPPEVGDHVFGRGETYVVREVREDEHRQREIKVIRRGRAEWIPAGRVELIRYHR